MLSTDPRCATSQEQDTVRQFLPLVHHVVSSMRGRVPSHVAVDDLTSAAMVGLLQAVRAYDEGRGVPFAAYATTRIRGAVLDELRRADWASRSVRAKARSLDEAAGATGAGLAEAAAAAGLTVEEASQVRADVERARVLSTDGAALVGQAMPLDLVTPETSLMDRERTGYLRDAVDLLPDRLRHVVVGIFFEDRTPAELAAELGVTESRISHMRAEATSLLREALGRAWVDDGAAPVQDGPAGGVAARRRAAYCATVAQASDYRERLDRPEPVTLPVPA